MSLHRKAVCANLPEMTRPLRSVKLILPALTEATSPYWRPIKYSLFPPRGWKKFERAWDLVIRLKQLSQLRPVLEAVLAPVNIKTPYKDKTVAALHNLRELDL